MAYKKQPATNTDVFGTFLSKVSSGAAASDSSFDDSSDAQTSNAPPPSTPDSVSVAVLLFLLENGPQPAGVLLSAVGMPLQDFFVATQSLQSRDLITSTQSDASEVFALTERGQAEAAHWKSMLGFMQSK